MKPRVEEVIVVEGRYDKNALLQVVDATVLEVHGFGVFHDDELLRLLRRLAKKQGVVILTDPDGAGFVIRSHLKGALGEGRVLHAYVPDRFGKERRKRTPSKEGKLGVEGMPPEALLEALENAGATIDGAAREEREAITPADLLERGLIGPGSSARRAALLRTLDLPAHLPAKALPEVLSLLMSRAEFLAMPLA